MSCRRLAAPVRAQACRRTAYEERAVARPIFPTIIGNLTLQSLVEWCYILRYSFWLRAPALDLILLAATDHFS